jgi:hypothetical protein
MRTLAAAPLFALAALAGLPAQAQDRYGGVNAYAPVGVQQQPQRVLSWPGKTIPAPPVAPTSPSAYYAGAPAYGATLQPAPYAQGRGAPIAPYAYQRNTTLYPPQAYAAQPQAPRAPLAYQPYPAPAPQAAPPQGYPPPVAYYPVPSYAPGQPAGYAPMGVYMPPPNSQPAQAAPAPPQPGAPVATAPSGVYPAQPGYPQPGYPVQGLPANAYPPAPFPQGPVPAAPFPTPQAANPQAPQTQSLPVPPNSIYAPTPQASSGPPADPAKPQMVAMNTAPAPGAGSKLYSVHRAFGLEPDHPTVSPQFFAESVDLAEPPPPVGRMRTTVGGAKTTRAAELRARQDDEDFGPNAD